MQRGNKIRITIEANGMGAGKTTLLSHIANLLEDAGFPVEVSTTPYTLGLEQAWQRMIIENRKDCREQVLANPYGVSVEIHEEDASLTD